MHPALSADQQHAAPPVIGSTLLIQLTLTQGSEIAVSSPILCGEHPAVVEQHELEAEHGELGDDVDHPARASA